MRIAVGEQGAKDPASTRFAIDHALARHAMQDALDQQAGGTVTLHEIGLAYHFGQLAMNARIRDPQVQVLFGVVGGAQLDSPQLGGRAGQLKPLAREGGDHALRCQILQGLAHG